MMFRIVLLVFVVGVFNSSCTKNIYDYDGVEYEVSTEIEKSNSETKALDLSGTYGDVPSQVFEMNNLVYLNLSNKNIKELNEEICNLKSLKILLLNENKMISIPACFFEMNNLELVSILGCRYDEIPRGFFDMRQLKTLAIMANNFTEEDLLLFKKQMPETKVIYSVD